MLEGTYNIEVSDNQIREYFKMLTLRPITQQTLSAGKYIARVAQRNIIETLKSGLTPKKTDNYYQIKADIIDKLFDELDKKSYTEP
jgi:hypothetical protein